ncbi:MAG: toll/interleukin-1 receptor domain-containing protein, partial [Capsulimonadaceae bacterium]
MDSANDNRRDSDIDAVGSRDIGVRQFAFDVFLSHSSIDKPSVLALAERLRADGMRVWFDEWEILPGDPIGLKIEQGLESSRVLVLAMSANSFGSDWVSLERHTTLFRDPTNRARHFVPLLISTCTIPDVLRQFRYIDYRTRSADSYRRLADACRPPAAQPRPTQSHVDTPSDDVFRTALESIRKAVASETPLERALADRVQDSHAKTTADHRIRCVAQWLSARHRFDQRFVSLSVLVSPDRDEDVRATPLDPDSYATRFGWGGERRAGVDSDRDSLSSKEWLGVSSFRF